MNKTYTLVANAGEARLFSGSGLGKKLSPVAEFSNSEMRQKEQDLVTDRAGRRQDVGEGNKSGMSEGVSAKETERQRFADTLAEHLNEARKADAFDRLILVASPQMLGELREALDSATAQTVVDTLDKNISELSVPDLNEKLAEQIAL